jgi:hypothetical protein
MTAMPTISAHIVVGRAAAWTTPAGGARLAQTTCKPAADLGGDATESLVRILESDNPPCSTSDRSDSQ